MTQALVPTTPDVRRTARPRVALLRGEALNPFEMQAYEPLTDEIDLLAVGRVRPPYELHRLPMPVRLLPSIAATRVTRGIYRRLPTAVRDRRDPAMLFGLRRAVADRQVLHAAETVLPVSEQAARVSARTGAHLVLTCWETIPFRYDDDPVLARRKQQVMSRAARYVAVTHRARRALLAEGAPDERITVIPAAVDCSRFRPQEASAALRESWGVPAGAQVVLYVGRLIQEKGTTELVQAFAAGGVPTAHLVLLGNGNQGARIRIAAEACGVAERVHVRPGVSYDLLPQVHASADVVVAPSLTTPYWEEQFGMVLAEAMACGRPLLTTASGAIPEVVGDAAEVVTPYDVPALAAGIADLLTDPVRRERLATAARARALRLYDVPVVARQLAAVYRELVGS